MASLRGASPNEVTLFRCIEFLNLTHPVPKTLKPFLKNGVLKTFNRGAFLNILYYLLSNLTDSKQLKKLHWPVIDHKDMSLFQKDVSEILSTVKTECPEFIISTPLPFIFRALGGPKVEDFFAELSFAAFGRQLFQQGGLLPPRPNVIKNSRNEYLVLSFLVKLGQGYLEEAIEAQTELSKASDLESEIWELEHANTVLQQKIREEEVGCQYHDKITLDSDDKFLDSVLEWKKEIDEKEAENIAKLEKISQALEAFQHWNSFVSSGKAPAVVIKANDIAEHLKNEKLSQVVSHCKIKMFKNDQMCWDGFVQLLSHRLERIRAIYNPAGDLAMFSELVEVCNELKPQLRNTVVDLENIEQSLFNLQFQLTECCQKLETDQGLHQKSTTLFNNLYQSPVLTLDGATSILHVSSPVKESATFLDEVKAKSCKSKIGSSLNSTVVSTSSSKTPNKVKKGGILSGSFAKERLGNSMSSTISNISFVHSPTKLKKDTHSTFLYEKEIKIESSTSISVNTVAVKSPGNPRTRVPIKEINENIPRKISTKATKNNLNTPVRKTNSRNNLVRPNSAGALMSPNFRSTPMKSPDKIMAKTIIDRQLKKNTKARQDKMDSPIFAHGCNLSSVTEDEDQANNSLVGLLDSLSLEESSEFGLECQENISFTPCKKGIPLEREVTPAVKKRNVRPSIDRIIQRYKRLKEEIVFEPANIEEKSEITEEFENVSYLD